MMNFMKKAYEETEIKIVVFDDDEVILASGVFNEKGEIEMPFVPAND